MIDAVVIKKKDYKESSELVTLFTKEYGKLNTVAHRSKLPKSPLFSSLHLFNLSTFDLKVKNTGLNTIISGEAKTTYKVNYSVFAQTAYAYCTELILYCFEERTKLSSTYDLLVHLFNQLENEDAMYYVMSQFSFHLLQHIDEPLSLKSCSHCHSNENTIADFSFEDRGFVCTKCLEQSRHGVGKQLLPYIFCVANKEVAKPTHYKDIEWEYTFQYIANYYENFLGIKPKSLSILKQLNRR